MSMNELETEAIVVASREYRERDLLVTLLTPQGKQGVNARGTLKIDSRNAAALQLCTKGIYRLSRSGTLASLKQAVIMESYPKLKRSLLGTAMAQVLCEIADQAQDDPACFTLLDGALTDMEQSGDLYSAPCVFINRMCALAGIAPMVDGCARCGRKDEISSLSLRQGGFLCRFCVAALHEPRWEKEKLRRFRLIAHADMDKLAILREHIRCDLDDLQHILSFYREYSGVSIRGAVFLKTAAALEKAHERR